MFRRLLALACFLAVLAAGTTSRAATTPEQIAELRTSSLLKQLEHIANSRGMPACEALARFGRFKPFDGALDPWGYKIAFGCDNNLLRVQSVGPDGQVGTSDDIVSGSTAVPLAAAPVVAQPPSPSKSAKATGVAGKRSSHRATGVVLLFVAGLVAWVVVSESRS